MKPEEKATGWKVPLAFCAVIALLALCGKIFLHKPLSPPALPPELIAAAERTHIDLDRQDGEEWQEAIRDAATGFQPTEVKDAKLDDIAGKALATGRVDAACAVIVHVRDDEKKQLILQKIHSFAMADCNALKWSVFAIHASPFQESMDSMAKELTAKWQECGKRLDKNLN